MMFFKHLIYLPFFLFLASPALAQEVPVPSHKPLSARVESNWRLGSERSILMHEFWVPITQREDRVIYTDFRFMGDDHDNRELNIGAGYRQITSLPVLGQGVAGAHLWFDRRLTSQNNYFNQITAGAEWFGDIWDLKLNTYVPLNKKESFTRANPTTSSSGFAGNQIVINTDQSVDEEALKGIDFELGWRVPIEDFTDSTRIYAGGYHFEGDKADNVSGWRARITSDITSDIQIGARFQRDEKRGSQGFLEATIRFPLGQKQSYKKRGLYARLDEAPERDIDIVSAEAIIDSGLNKTLTNAVTGQAQNIIHVDNTAGGGGTGTNESRFDTLAAAEAAAGTNDIIYVHFGNGGTAGQDAGITIDDTGQMLIGSGADLTFDGTRFGTSNGSGIASQIIIPKTTAPLLTNGGGHGVLVTADNTFLSGFTIDSATGIGVYVLNNSGSVWNKKTTIQDITATNNATLGIRIDSNGVGSTIDNLAISGLTTTGNGTSGLFLYALNNGQLDSVSISDVTASSNTQRGIYLLAQTGGQLNNATLSGDIIANNNTLEGVRVQSNGAGVTLNNLTLSGLTATGNGADGLWLYALNNGQLNNADVLDVTASNNTQHGIYLLAQTGSQLNNASISDVIASSNTQRGIYLLAQTGGDFSASLDNSTFTGNIAHGVYVDDDTAGVFTADLGGGTLGSTGGNSIFGNTGTDIRVDLDNLELKAENNWWGVDTGLAGGETTLEGLSTIDTDPFLTSAP